jgi:hypothetical protein
VAVVGLVQYIYLADKKPNDFTNGVLPPILEYTLLGILLIFIAITVVFILYSNRWFTGENHMI